MLVTVQDLKGLGYDKGKPVGLVGVTELSDAQKKQLKEQQEVMPQIIPEVILLCGVAGLDGKMVAEIARKLPSSPQINLQDLC